MDTVEEEVIQVIKDSEAPVVGAGIIHHRLHQRGIAEEQDYREVLDILENMRERGVVKLHMGEWEEYSLHD